MLESKEKSFHGEENLGSKKDSRSKNSDSTFQTKNWRQMYREKVDQFKRQPSGFVGLDNQFVS